MERRQFGKHPDRVSILGLGGYHLLEIPQREVEWLVSRYLDAGGNYVETAYGYGKGESETRLGVALGQRRKDVFLATKVGARDAARAAQIIDLSLRNLRTDHVDLLFMHAVGTYEDLSRILAEDGAVRAAERARRDGKVRYIGISMHGWPDTLIAAIKQYPFDAVMHTFNYFDRFNFPESEKLLLPLAQEKGVAVVGMKPVADGFLYRSPGPAFRYAFSLPVATVVSGFNTREMLEMDLRFAEEFTPMTETEKEELFRKAPELGSYVCRLCDKCLPAPEGVPIPQIFQLEGMYDRQMRDGVVRTAAEFALRDRLRFWYGTQDEARRRYAALQVNPDNFSKAKALESKCPYSLPIYEKLRLAHYKLTGDQPYF